ncbi:MAG: hypothetical protein HKP09_02190, partial [Enterobacterales bacterium]|nr:hypothetical protein [Enterobacterales bacterium]
MSESKLKTIFQELRRRRVFRVATLYVVTMWPLIQIIDILSPVLNISDGTIRSIVFYFILGFPIAIGTAWLYNLTPQGLVKNDNNLTQQNDSILGNRMELLIIIFFATIAVVLFTFQDKLVVEQPIDDLERPVSLPLNATLATNYQSIAVLPFVPFSDDKQDEFFADGLAEELLNVLAKI